MRRPYPQIATSHPISPFRLKEGLGLSLALLLLLPFSSAFGQSLPQVNTAITSDGSLGTTIIQNGSTREITGGTRPGNGANLFHSFGQFSIGTGDLANFLNDSGLPTHHIFNRVTGGDPSHIFGTIKTTNFGSANLYLLNPAGVIFGPTATLEVGGSFYVTTADYLRFSDGHTFQTIFSPDEILSVGDVATFGFTAENPKAINIDRSVLEVGMAKVVSVVAGQEPVVLDADPGIRMTGGSLSAPEGQVNIVGVASNGELPFDHGAVNLPLEGGRIDIQDFLVDVSGVQGGTVVIRGGELQIDGSQMFANTRTGDAGGVSVNGEIVTLTGSQFGSETRGNGNAGTVSVTGKIVNILSSDGKPSLFSSATTGDGNGGDVSVAGETVTVMEGRFFTDSGTNLGVGTGDAGRVSVTGETVTLENGTFRSVTNGDGDAGEVSVTGRTVSVTGGEFFSDSGTTSSVGAGNAGDVSVGGNDTMVLTLTNVSRVSSVTSGDGNAGNVSVTGKTVTLTGGDFKSDSGTTSGVGAGNAGKVSVTGETVTVTDASFLSNSFSARGGNAGEVSVKGEENVSLTGATLQSAAVPVSDGAESNGNAGNVSVTGENLVLENTRVITLIKGTGAGGSITLKSGGEHPLSLINTTLNSSVKDIPMGSDPEVGLANIALSGPRIEIVGGSFETRSTGSRQGGTVTLAANQTLSLNQTQVSVQSSGTGDAGDINLESGTSLLLNQSDLNAEASQVSGGDITLIAQDLIFTSGSNILASVQGGTETRGGNIRIDPEFVVIQQSNLRANAVRGTGGNIFIQGGTVLIDPDSTISVKSEFGQSGLIQIESPLRNLNQFLAPLSEEIVQVAKVFEACTGGQTSSLVKRLREGGPAEPGFPLASPVEGLGMASGSEVSTHNSHPPLQAWRLGMLKNIEQPGFSYPMEWGCES